MTTLKPRNRLVVFRLSQEEYHILKSACSTQGGRNISDFTRSELLALIQSRPAGDGIQKRLVEMEQKLADMHGVLLDLSRRLDCAPLVSLSDSRTEAGGEL
jgi:hypothetical protein